MINTWIKPRITRNCSLSSGAPLLLLIIALRVAFAIINTFSANQHKGVLIERRIEYPDVAVSPFAITVGDKVSLPGHLVLVTSDGASDRL